MHYISSRFDKITRYIVISTLVFLTVYFFMSFFLKLFAPFITAMVVAAINEPLIRILEKKAKFPRSIAAFLSLLTTVAAAGVFLFLIMTQIFNELAAIQSNLPSYVNTLSAKITFYCSSLPASISDTLGADMRSSAPKLTDTISSVISSIITTLKAIPMVTLYVFVSLVAAYFISSDRKRMEKHIYGNIPADWTNRLKKAKARISDTILGYFKAYLILMFFTFLQVSLGLIFLHEHFALVIGALTAISVMVPFLGTGLVLVPWIIWNLAGGNIQKSLGLCAIYLLGIILRQLLLPKILDSQIRIHPFAMLIYMYVGYRLAGIPGLIGGILSLTIAAGLDRSNPPVPLKTQTHRIT